MIAGGEGTWSDALVYEFGPAAKHPRTVIAKYGFFSYNHNIILVVQLVTGV